MSRAWVEIVARPVGDDPDFDAFVARRPDLLDKRHYRSATPAAPAARTGLVPPDLRSW
jgi:hypothetical protein